jgi:membrane associated rhomboid family serine protease
MPERERPWKSDSEIEASERRRRAAAMAPSRRLPNQPVLTYALLGLLVIVFVAEAAMLGAIPSGDTITRDQEFIDTFTIHSESSTTEWMERPWSPFTAMVSHGSLLHLLFNGLFLFFFGPSIEKLAGRIPFLIFFVVAGAGSSIVQAMLDPVPALGASGALMGILGISMIVIPNSKMIIFPVPVPIPLWIGGTIFAIIDVLGVFSPDLGQGVGNFAHLAGLAMGLLYGFVVRAQLKAKGMR